MAERTLTGPRRLTQDIPEYLGIYDPALVFPDYKGWANEGLPNALIYETYFDMGGLTLDDLTFVPQGAELQDPGRYIMQNFPVGDVEVIDIISQERLTLTDIDANLALNNVPGMMESTEDFTQIIFGQYRSMLLLTTSANVELLSTVAGATFGSAEASAAAKLWCYRVVRINGNDKPPGFILKIPASRFVMIGTTVEEKELPYMMRLKRSYELSTQG
jgi:hypothetical protein